MLGFGNLSTTAIGAKALSAVTLAQAQAEPAATAAAAPPETTSLVHPALVVVLCAIAAAGTVMLLPGRRESAWRSIGGILIAAAAAVLMLVLINVVRGAGFGGLGAYFWIFSIIALFGALRVITHTKPVYSALYFVLTVLASAGLFVLLWAEFMAVALVIIYAGAILVTYVFVIMLAAEAAPPRPGGTAPGTHDTGAIAGLADYDRVSREPVAATAVGFTLLAVLLVVILDTAAVMPPHALLAANLPDATQPIPPEILAAGPTQALGAYLFENHLVSLELAGLILTLAMVGAIIIARRRVLGPAPVTERTGDTIIGPATPVDDNPHSIPVYGTDNPRQKAYPET